MARAILRLEVPRSELPEGESVDRAGYWLLVRLSGEAPVRLSELADTVELDLSTVSRQMPDLVAIGLVLKVPDPEDGRARCSACPSGAGRCSTRCRWHASRRWPRSVDDWSDGERTTLTQGLSRLEAGTPPDARTERPRHEGRGVAA